MICLQKLIMVYNRNRESERVRKKRREEKERGKKKKDTQRLTHVYQPS